MIANLFIYLATIMVKTIAIILPEWQIWPQTFLDALSYFFTEIAKWNYIFPIDSLFAVLTFVIGFEVAYFTAKLVLKVFNYFRGTGSGLDI